MKKIVALVTAYHCIGTDKKIKSQCGGPVDVYVKYRTKWSNAHLLVGNGMDETLDGWFSATL